MPRRWNRPGTSCGGGGLPISPSLGLTAFVSLFALRLVLPQSDCVLDITETWLRTVWSLLTWAIGTTATGWVDAGWTWLIGHVGPALGWAAFLVPSFAKYPLTGFLALGLLAFVFFVWSDRLQRRIEVHAEWAWAVQKGLPAAARPKTDWYNSVARRLRPVTRVALRLGLARAMRQRARSCDRSGDDDRIAADHEVA